MFPIITPETWRTQESGRWHLWFDKFDGFFNIYKLQMHKSEKGQSRTNSLYDSHFHVMARSQNRPIIFQSLIYDQYKNMRVF